MLENFKFNVDLRLDTGYNSCKFNHTNRGFIMNLQNFKELYASSKNADKITIDCDHESHVGPRNREIGKQAAERNILKNNGEQFVCRDCMMKHDNPMTRPRDRRQTDELITVTCPCPEHVGELSRQIKMSAWFGPVQGPFEKTCKACAQLGREVSQEQRDKISSKLSGIERSDEFKQKISEYMKNNAEGIARATRNIRENQCTTGMLGKTHSNETKEKMASSHAGKTFSPEHRQNISEGRKKMLEETGGFTKEHRENISKATLRQYANGFKPQTLHIRGWHESPKAGNIYFSSSYEKKAYLKLDEDESVKIYSRESITVPYLHPIKNTISNYIIDLQVKYFDGSEKWIEIKPSFLTNDEIVKTKANAATIAAKKVGVNYEIWTEVDLFGAVYRPNIIEAFCDRLKDSLTGETKAEADRKESNNRKAKKHYDDVIAKDTVEVFCNFCKETHNPLRITYEKNIERNGEYICEKHGGFIAGSKPKKKKINPYAVDGKKECNRCKEVKLLEEFGDDKTKSDGKATRCKKCRAEIATEKYQAKR